MYIKRDLEDTILRYLVAPEIIAIVGARRCGKTTLVRHIFSGLKNAAAISFDDRSALELFENSPDDFIVAYIKGNKYLFIDEFQYAKNGGKILKYIYDSQKIKIVISGSSAPDLTIKAIKYLVGRVFVLNLYPFNFREFLRAKDANYLKIYEKYKSEFDLKNPKTVKIPDAVHKKLSRYFEEYILFGGYPRVVIEENRDSKKEILKNIYNTYFLREVRDILGLIDDYKLSKLVKGLALQIGGLTDYGDLTRLSGYSYPSLKKYLNFLEKTFICVFVRPFFKNKRVEIVKNPKVYFFDTGLRNATIDDFRKLEDRPDTGALLENGLAMQFIKNGMEFNFWRDKRKNELDFVIPLGDRKFAAVESKKYLKSLRLPAENHFRKLYPDIDIYLSYKDIDKDLAGSKTAYPIYLY